MLFASIISDAFKFYIWIKTKEAASFHKSKIIRVLIQRRLFARAQSVEV